MPRYSALGVLWILTALCLLQDVQRVAAERGTNDSNSNKTGISDDHGKKSSGNSGFPSSIVPLSGSQRTVSQEAGSEGSATVQKRTRQVFSEDEPSRGRDDQRRPISSSESTEEKPKRNKIRARPREEFNGFPADFTDGLKPFSFQSSKSPQDAPTSGFVDFPSGDFSSLASTLGGLEPFSPQSSGSSTSATRGSTSPASGEVTGSSGHRFSHDDLSPTAPAGTSSESFRSGSARKQPGAETGFGIATSGNPSFRPEADKNFPPRSSQRDPTFDGREFSSDDGQDQFLAGKGGIGRQLESSSAEEKQIRAPPGRNDFGGLDNFEQFDSGRFHPEPNTFSKRPTEGSEDPASTSTSSSERSRFQAEQESPTSNFRDLNQFQQGAPQNFLPVAHFHNGPFPFPQQFGFRPPQDRAAQSPPVRSFRHVAPPQFYITSGGNFDGNGFFENGGGSPPDFSRGPTQSFHRSQQQQPQFHFQSQQPSHQSHRSHQRQHHQPSNNNFHSDDTTTHHSSATNNILGSGNFGIIRGGIFADDENPPQSFRPQFGGHHGGGGSDDFFHGFRDFQPYGGPLNNALSNIQNAGTKTQAVTAQAKMTATSK